MSTEVLLPSTLTTLSVQLRRLTVRMVAVVSARAARPRRRGYADAAEGRAMQMRLHGQRLRSRYPLG